jgi:tripeptidyl-peptidase I
MTMMVAVVALVAATVAAQSDLVRFDMETERAFGGHLVSDEWVHVRRANSVDELSLVFAVRQRNAELLKRILYDVSEPNSPKYGDHLTFEQLGDIMRDSDAVQVVKTWLHKHGVNKIDETMNGDFIVASMSAKQAETLLGADVAEFHVYKSTITNNVIFRTRSYTVPAAVDAAIDWIFRCVDFPNKINAQSVFTKATNNTGKVIPSTLWNYYGIPSTPPTPATGNAVSLFEAIGQSFSPQDLAKFQSEYGVEANPVAKIIGPNTPANCLFQPNDCAECSLDIQVATGVAQGIPTWFWAVAQNDQTIFLDWIMAVANTTNPPLVHSISYGGQENGEPLQTATRFDMELQKLGARGLTVFIASGDDGAPGSGARNNPLNCGFNPSFPATSSFCTAVGATMGPEAGKPETPCLSQNGGLISSGGGFSGYFARESYQESTVDGYLKSGVKIISGFNTTGRAYPDVAALGHNYVIRVMGQEFVGSGTSASTPAWAGMVTLINNDRLAAGKKPLGFLNPALYQLQDSVFHKQTTGENHCAASSDPSSADCCTQGFFASTSYPKWNPVTGLGSPKYADLQAALMKL